MRDRTVVSLLAEVSHDEAKMPRRERPLLAGNTVVGALLYLYYIQLTLKWARSGSALIVRLRELSGLYRGSFSQSE